MDNVKKVERQVVAGTNYRVTVHLKSSCVIPGGAGEAVIKCRKLKVFVPLPVNCNNPNPDNPKGLSIYDIRLIFQLFDTASPMSTFCTDRKYTG